MVSSEEESRDWKIGVFRGRLLQHGRCEVSVGHRRFPYDPLAKNDAGRAPANVAACGIFRIITTLRTLRLIDRLAVGNAVDHLRLTLGVSAVRTTLSVSGRVNTNSLVGST